MTSYLILILVIDILILAGMTIHGIHKGFARLVSKMISLLVAVMVVILLSSALNGYRSGNTSNLLIGVLLLIILGVIYKIVHVILVSIRFLAGLPILAGLDKAMGAVTGFIEGFAILYLGEYLLRMYLLY